MSYHILSDYLVFTIQYSSTKVSIECRRVLWFVSAIISDMVWSPPPPSPYLNLYWLAWCTPFKSTSLNQTHNLPVDTRVRSSSQPMKKRDVAWNGAFYLWAWWPSYRRVWKNKNHKETRGKSHPYWPSNTTSIWSLIHGLTKSKFVKLQR